MSQRTKDLRSMNKVITIDGKQRLVGSDRSRLVAQAHRIGGGVADLGLANAQADRVFERERLEGLVRGGDFLLVEEPRGCWPGGAAHVADAELGVAALVHRMALEFAGKLGKFWVAC